VSVEKIYILCFDITLCLFGLNKNLIISFCLFLQKNKKKSGKKIKNKSNVLNDFGVNDIKRLGRTFSVFYA
jgi:hypothetical protein